MKEQIDGPEAQVNRLTAHVDGLEAHVSRFEEQIIAGFESVRSELKNLMNCTLTVLAKTSLDHKARLDAE